MHKPSNVRTFEPSNAVLHIGAGKRKIAGAVTLDINPRVNPDVVWDLNVFPYPFEDSQFDRVVCEHVIEHLAQVISVMEELHRVTKPGGRIHITVPHFSSLNFNTDPTHVHAFSSRSFDYLCVDTDLVKYDYSTVRFRKRLGRMTMQPMTGLNRLLMRQRAYTLAARLAFESYDDASSAHYYTEALAAAGRLRDSWYRAAVRTSQAMVTLYATGNLLEAQAIADAAVSDARKGHSARIRSRALALQAEMTARAANIHRAFAALHNAWHELDHTSDSDTAPDAFDAGRLQGFEGVCQLYAGDPAKAERQFADSAATLTRPRDVVQRGIVHTDQAKARILLAAPEAATALLHECIDLSTRTRGRVADLRIREARLALTPWRGERFVAELDDHIHTASIAGA